MDISFPCTNRKNIISTFAWQILFVLLYKALTYSLATHLGLTPGLPSDGQNLELTPTANRAAATNK